LVIAKQTEILGVKTNFILKIYNNKIITIIHSRSKLERNVRSGARTKDLIVGFFYDTFFPLNKGEAQIRPWPVSALNFTSDSVETCNNRVYDAVVSTRLDISDGKIQGRGTINWGKE
jgi:hypothetical protein